MTWQDQQLPEGHPPAKSGKVGVLLVNLGTPAAPSVSEVKRYLAEFLSDRRVIEIPPIAWQPILRGVILNTRPAKSAEAYSKVWSEDGSPLAAITKAQAEAMQRAFGAAHDGRVIIDWAMRYGEPTIHDKLAALHDAGCDRILLAPLLGVTLIILQERFLSYGAYVDRIILGTLLIMALSFLPRGLYGLVQDTISALRRPKNQPLEERQET